MVAYACNANTLGGQHRRITWGQEFKTNLGNLAKPSLQKIKKHQLGVVAQSLVPVTTEADVGGLFWSQEFEAAMSHDCATVLQPAWQR